MQLFIHHPPHRPSPCLSSTWSLDLSRKVDLPCFSDIHSSSVPPSIKGTAVPLLLLIPHIVHSEGFFMFRFLIFFHPHLLDVICFGNQTAFSFKLYNPRIKIKKREGSISHVRSHFSSYWNSLKSFSAFIKKQHEQQEIFFFLVSFFKHVDANI